MLSSSPNDPAHDRAESIVVAMSGGVDSSVAAHLLSRDGHSLVGLFMRNGIEVPAAEVPKKSCCSSTDARDARMVAAKLAIPFQAVDLGDEFARIIDFFVAEYGRGRTPNPCALCNRDLKFGRLFDFADELGCDAVATGHYARIDVIDGRPHLCRGVDVTKDQSYQLFSVSEAHLVRTRLPLGALTKNKVRDLAKAAGIRTAAKPDSQEICFVPSGDYRKLLAERKTELHSGFFVDRGGKRLGQHAGTEHFTIGQRRGHGIGGGTPLYVTALRPLVGEVQLGPREECFSRALTTSGANWIGFDPPACGGHFRAHVQVRYHHDAALATIEMLSGGNLGISFDVPQAAVAPGQGAAVYIGDRLVGGGWIESTIPLESATSDSTRSIS